jgi:hypothetical protein
MGERIARIVRISDFRNLSAALVDPRPYCDLKAQADSPFERSPNRRANGQGVGAASSARSPSL